MELFQYFAWSRQTVIEAALLLLLLSIICQIIIGVIYRNMIRQAENMAATSNRLLKQCKLKFSHCYQMNRGAVNVGVFVDRFMSRLRIGRLSFSSLQHLSGQLLLLSVFAAGLGACRDIAGGKTLGAILPYYLVSLLNLYVYFSVTSLVDLPARRETLKTCIADYLENHMMTHLQTAAEEGQAASAAAAEQPAGEAAAAAQEEAGRETAPFTGQDEAELLRLIREFLA